jgi:hypothetical protein
VNSIQIQIQFKSRSLFEFLFKIGYDLVQLISVEVAPNDVIYLLANFQIFLRSLTIFLELIHFLYVWKSLNKKSETFSFP